MTTRHHLRAVTASRDMARGSLAHLLTMHLLFLMLARPAKAKA
jgi:hypothetical protein